MTSRISAKKTTIKSDIYLKPTRRVYATIGRACPLVSEVRTADMIFAIPNLIVQPVEMRLRLLGDLSGVEMSNMQAWTLYDFYYKEETEES